MILFFGFGFVIVWGLYKEFYVDEVIGFGVFGLFIGIVFVIIVFFVFCCIFFELNFFCLGVGVIVLVVGIGNDVIGWVFFVFCVVLINNSSGLVVFWVLFCCIGWILFFIFVIWLFFIWIFKWIGSLYNGFI